VAAELISDLERIYQRKKAANMELQQLVAATGSTPMDLHGIGPSGAGSSSFIDEMMIATAIAIAKRVHEDVLNPAFIFSSVFDPSVAGSRRVRGR
jgi:hypothetical protein